MSWSVCYGQTRAQERVKSDLAGRALGFGGVRMQRCEQSLARLHAGY